MPRGKAAVRAKLNEFYATAIAGNDILSSTLYVSAVAIIFSGIYAPLVLVAVAGVLYLYRSVYREVVEALPANGGAYNALLNGTSKTFAAVAGIMTALSYIATATISAKTAIEYLFRLVGEFTGAAALAPWILPAVLLLLFIFAVLVSLGVKDSARVAGAIFLFNLGALGLFVIVGLFAMFSGDLAIGRANAVQTVDLVRSHGGLLKMLFLAFAASLLGISGFESSANYIEEQQPGVFKKTLRNMTLGVLILNPVIAYVVLNTLPLGRALIAKDFLLAETSLSIGGEIFLALVAVDAFLVLSGAVLASYVGVAGLAKRMALDGCLPKFLLKGETRRSYPRIIFAFFLLCAAILALTRGELLALAGVYTVSFLGVMTLFAAANLILRSTRRDLKRPYVAPLPLVLLAFAATTIGLLGNLSIDPRNAGYFLAFFIPAALLVFSMIYRKDLFLACEKFTRFAPPLSRRFARLYERTLDDSVHVFVHHVDRLATILEYVKNNESAHRITLVHCKHGQANRSGQLQKVLRSLEEAGFLPNYKVGVKYVDEIFSPAVVRRYARAHRVDPSRIYIGSIHHEHPFVYEDFGGVRIIH